MNIALRKRALSPVRLVLEDSSKRSSMLFVGASLHLWSTSLGARAMHGFGAEVFIEEVQCYDDMMIYSTGVSFLA